MQCQYCDSFITPYPTDGLCPNCGAKLPPDNTPKELKAGAKKICVTMFEAK